MARSLWTAIRLQRRELWSIRWWTSLKLAHYGFRLKQRISSSSSSEECSYVIALSERLRNGCSYAFGSNGCSVYRRHAGGGAGSDGPQMGAFRRIFLLPSRRRRARHASTWITPSDQPPGTESAGRGRQPHLQLQSLVRPHPRYQHSQGKRSSCAWQK